MLALKHGNENAQRRLLEILGSRTRDPDLLQEAVMILEETGVLAESRQIADRFVLENKNIVEDLSSLPKIYRQRLKAFVDYVVQRSR